MTSSTIRKNTDRVSAVSQMLPKPALLGLHRYAIFHEPFIIINDEDMYTEIILHNLLAVQFRQLQTVCYGSRIAVC